MSSTLAVPSHGPSSLPLPLRWSGDQFHAACDSGVFEGQNVILVDGEILEMPAPNPPHNSGVELVRSALQAAFGPGHWIRVQMALDLALDTDPVPDVSVIIGTPRTIQDQPTTALLVVEVSDSTLATDLGLKSHLYAQGGIRDYWVLDLNGGQLHVFRDPLPDANAPRGHRYHSVQQLGSSASLAPLALPGTQISIADLLP